MSTPAPLGPDEERKRRSTRLAIGILVFSGGCGCLVLVLAFAGGMVLGAVESWKKSAPVPVPTSTEAEPDEEPIELRAPSLRLSE